MINLYPNNPCLKIFEKPLSDIDILESSFKTLSKEPSSLEEKTIPSIKSKKQNEIST